MRNEELKKAREKLANEMHISVNELDNILINALMNVKSDRIARNSRISNERLNELLEGYEEGSKLLMGTLSKTKMNPNALTTEISEVAEVIEYKDFRKDDILRLIKLNPYDLAVKSAYSGVPLNKFIYRTDEREQNLMKRILSNVKFKNVRIDKNLISLLMFTDNTIFKRQLFYPAFFIDADFKFDERFVVKGMLAFECNSVEKIENDKRIVKIISFDERLPVNDIRIHFTLIDTQRGDVTSFGVSFDDVEKGKWLWAESRILPEYQDEKEILKELVGNIVRIVCNVIDLIEGNKDELEIKLIVPPVRQNEKRIRKGKSPIATTVIIKPKKELLSYSEAFEREHRKMKYSHRFVVRGHWRHLNSEWYKGKQGKKIWIRPFLKGKGILIKKDALFTDNKQGGDIPMRV